MKKFSIVCLLFIAGSLSAQTGIFAGLGVETNANTREGATFGGSLASGLDLNQWFCLGVKIAFSADMGTVNTLELPAFFRYYLPLKLSGLFAQAELGGSFFFYDGETYPAFLGGLAVGWRYDTGKNWYIEPSVRGGYPFVWGVGLQAGTSFDL
ncbi:MAG: hypothetical protein LBB72_03295 [Spirochaetaceae bacterium]|jgi:hypothetical protein|nr:hypothetical protein [Spirochaetaceae bacterium]